MKREEILKFPTSVFLLLLCVVFRLCEFLQRGGGRGKNLLLSVLSLSLGAFLHKLLDLQRKPPEFILVFLIQIVLELWTQATIFKLQSTGNQKWPSAHVILKKLKVKIKILLFRLTSVLLCTMKTKLLLRPKMSIYWYNCKLISNSHPTDITLTATFTHQWNPIICFGNFICPVTVK